MYVSVLFVRLLLAELRRRRLSVDAALAHAGIDEAILAVGTGVGLGVGLGYKDLYEGLSIGVGIFAIAEMLILTRPNIYHTPEKRPTFALKNVRMSPWADKYARGIGLAGRF